MMIKIAFRRNRFRVTVAIASMVSDLMIVWKGISGFEQLTLERVVVSAISANASLVKVAMAKIVMMQISLPQSQ
jgi:hypothetical protein